MTLRLVATSTATTCRRCGSISGRASRPSRMPTTTPSSRRSPAASASATAPSRSAPITVSDSQKSLDHSGGLIDRGRLMDLGETKIRSHLGRHAPLKLTLIFAHENKRWEVLTQYIPEGHAALLLGSEDL